MGEDSIEKKILAAFERICSAIHAQMRPRAYELRLSPSQAQLLVYLSVQPSEKHKIHEIAKTFGLTKSTVSIVVKTLEKKGLVRKEKDPKDSRSTDLYLTDKGKSLVKHYESWSKVLVETIASLKQSDMVSLWIVLLKLINNLNEAGIITLQRNCFACLYLKQSKGKWYCNFLRKPLSPYDLRWDCEDFEPVNATS